MDRLWSDFKWKNMKLIKKIVGTLLVVQIFSLYIPAGDAHCAKMGCCGQLAAKPLRSCSCTSTYHQPVLTNNSWCNCADNFNIQTPLPKALSPETDTKFSFNKIQTSFMHLEHCRGLGPAGTFTARIAVASFIARPPSPATYLLNCNFLI
jgi:hypothetical protein